MKNIYKHPTFSKATTLAQICEPLRTLNISYFCKVKIQADNQFVALTNHPDFAEHYVKNQYYNVDIHVAKLKTTPSFILWDFIEVQGNAAKMGEAALAFDIDHTLTIFRHLPNGDEYYHFAAHPDQHEMNHMYFIKYDLLLRFIHYFNAAIAADTALSRAYDLSFELTAELSDEFILSSTELNQREKFLSMLGSSPFSSQSTIISHKDTQIPVKLGLQQAKCFELLLQGYSIKQIANQLNLSPKTIEYYLAIIRKRLGCTTSKEMIAAYHTVISLY